MKDRYFQLGTGEQKVMVLHDFFASTASYLPLHDYLDKETYTYVFFDMRGYGKSKEIQGDYSLSEASQDCIALANHLNWGSFHAVGHSMSGMVIQYLNSQIPDRILSATAITPVPATGSSIPDDFLEYTRAGIRGDDSIIAEIIRNTSGGRYNEAFVQFKLKQFRSSATIEARLSYLNMFSQNNISKEVQGLATPYHVIIGLCDTPWHNREMMEKTFGLFFPNCTISEIADASHFPMQETPILLASYIESFLKKTQLAHV